MNMLMTRILAVTTLAIFLACSALAADQKIATIDLKKVFDDYFKTKLADAQIKEEATGLDKDRKALTEQYQKLTEDYKKAVDDANNQAVSGDEREKRKKAAEGKLIEINDLEGVIKQFDRTARGNLEEKQRIAREKLLTEIRAIVASKVKAGGYTLVLDTAGEGLSRTPVVFFSSGENDITASVLTQLNANAPADLLKSEGRKEDKK
jgi:outer membrane protein